MRRQPGVLVLATISVVGCSRKDAAAPTLALDVCYVLHGARIASECHAGKPVGPGAGAVESADFELSAVPEHEGTVYRYANLDAYDKGVDAFAKAWMITGPYRYGSRKRLIFVDLSPDTPSTIGAQVKAIVDAL